MPRKKAIPSNEEKEGEALSESMMNGQSEADITESNYTDEANSEAMLDEKEESFAEVEMDESEETLAEDEMDEIVTQSEKEDDNVAVIEDETEYIMSERMHSLINAAIFRHERLTGELVGIEMTPEGVVANVIYKGNTNDLLYDYVTVKISADKMGLNNEEIERAIQRTRSQAQRRLSADEIEYRKRRIQYSLLNEMLGAVVDFVPLEIFKESKSVVGSRIEAMRQKRRFILPSDSNPIPQIQVGSTTVARIMRVNPVSMVVEVSGIEVIMPASSITAMAVNLTEKFKVGERIRVLVRDVKDGKISVVSTTINLVNQEKKATEYRVGTIAVAQIYFRNARTGMLYLRMPNGCHGLSYFDKSSFRINPRVGDNVSVIITGKSARGSVVRCRIRKIL